MSDILYWLWLSLATGPAFREASSLISEYNDAKTIYELDGEALSDADLPQSLKKSLSDKDLSEAKRIVDFCSVKRIGILTYADKRYPERLRLLQDFPIVLYYKGELIDFNENVSVGVVGTRSMSAYGKNAAYEIAYDLALCGAVVVSGMALGIDGMSAAAALTAGGKTVAVLGCGIDVIYPAEHRKLYEQIAGNGMVISEYPPGTRADGRNFPKRNRIITGISNCTLVIEADMESGAMISARLAVAQGKKLFAVPGMIDRLGSEGTNSLLRDGAEIALNAQDVLQRYIFLYPDKIDLARRCKAPRGDADTAAMIFEVGTRPPLDSDKEEKIKINKIAKNRNSSATSGEKPADDSVYIDRSVIGRLDKRTQEIYNFLQKGKPILPDECTDDAKNIGEIMGALTVLEISGAAKRLPGGRFIIFEIENK